jgi:hypothetical protein
MILEPIYSKVKDFTIKKISCKDAMRIVVAQHYLHRKGPCSFAFGLFNSDKLIGVITYGTPSSCTLRTGICGPKEAFNVIELTRLWVDSEAPKNSESYLIGNTIKLVDKEIVVSYADTSEGHLGIVYQASNFIYTGLSAKRSDWTVKGIEKHNTTLVDKYTAKEIREKYGDAFELKNRPRKHRYVYFNADKRRKRELLAALRYEICPYPKKQLLNSPYPHIS